MPSRFLTGFITASFLAAPVVFAADQSQKKSKESDEVAQAIAFERQKDAAAARQARIEAKHPTVTYSNSDAESQQSADREKSNSRNGQAKPEQRK